MLYTSGTTGAPKGTIHSHQTLIAPVRASIRLRELFERTLPARGIGLEPNLKVARVAFDEEFSRLDNHRVYRDLLGALRPDLQQRIPDEGWGARFLQAQGPSQASLSNRTAASESLGHSAGQMGIDVPA